MKTLLFLILTLLVQACGSEGAVQFNPSTMEIPSMHEEVKSSLETCKVSVSKEISTTKDLCIQDANEEQDVNQTEGCQKEYQRILEVHEKHLSDKVNQLERERKLCIVSLLGSSSEEQAYAFCDKEFSKNLNNELSESCRIKNLKLQSDLFEWRLAF